MCVERKVKTNPTEQRRTVTKKCRPGPIMRNPYLNFVREFRMNHGNTGLTPTQLVKKAALAWTALSKQDRIKYIVDAFYAKKIKYTRRKKKDAIISAKRRIKRKKPTRKSSKKRLRRRA